MSSSEISPLIPKISRQNDGLSVFFAVVCIIDVFGVFPIVALPKAIIDCGFYGIPVVFLVCSLQMYTANLLGKCWIMAEKVYPSIHRKDRYPYSALTEVTFGKILSKCVEILLDVTIFGAGVPNLILASQNIQLLGMKISSNTFDISYCYWIIIIGTILCPILWLGSPKDLKLLCTISVVSVSSVFLLVSACFIFANSKENIPENDGYTPERPLWEIMLTAYGIIAFQFDIHPSILTIQVDMKEPRKLTSAVLGGFFVSVSMAGITTVIAASKYGTAVLPSVLETLPSSVALHFAAFLVALQLCLTSAVSNSALYQHMEDCLGISRYFNHKRCILRTILTFLAIILAESVPRFDLVMSLIGGTLTGPLMFILPPLIYIKMLTLHKTNEEKIQMQTFTNTLYYNDEKGHLKKITKKIPIDDEIKIKNVQWSLNEKIQVIFCVLIIFLSSGMTGITTYFNFNNAMNYANFSKPCIYNISASLLYL